MGFFDEFTNFFNFIHDPAEILPEDVYRVLFDPAQLFHQVERPEAGAPETQQFSMVNAKEGLVIPEILGTTKIIGNIFHYWDNESKSIFAREKEKALGGFGGSDSIEIITGYTYHLSWLQGISFGQTDVLYAVYESENVVWAGELERPVSGGESTISLTKYSDGGGNGDDIGDMTFYFGTNDQVLNTDYEDGLLDITLNTPYRNLCYAFFDNVKIETSNRVPVFSFVIGKRPVLAFNDKETINTYDYNGAHAIWYILTEMLDIPEASLDEVSFSEVADTLFAENFGVDILMDSKSGANAYLENLLLHLNAIIFYDTDAKLHLKLIRADVNVEDMLSITDSDILKSPQISRGSWEETINEIRGSYPFRIEVIPQNKTAKSIIVDIADSYDEFFYNIGIRSIDFYYNGNLVEINSSALIDIIGSGSTSNRDPGDTTGFVARNVFDTSISKIGDSWRTEWQSDPPLPPLFEPRDPQRLFVVFDSIITFDTIVVNNSHYYGISTSYGVKNVKIYTSLEVEDSTVYDDVPSDWFQIYNGTFDEHVEENVQDDQELVLRQITTGTTPKLQDLANNLDVTILNYKDGVTNPDDLANKDIQGKIVEESIFLPLVQKKEQAYLISDRLLQSRAYPLLDFNLVGNRKIARLQRGDLFKFSYSPYGIVDMVCRVMETQEDNLETENTLLTVKQDIDYLGQNIDVTNASVIGADGNTVQSVSHFVPDLANIKVIETPYVIYKEGIGILPIASRVYGTETSYQVYISIDGSTYSLLENAPEFAPSGSLVAEYCIDTNTIDDSVGFTISSTDVDIDNIDSIERSLLFLDNNLALLGDEIISFQTITQHPTIDDQYIITGVYRGRFDTDKETHPIGTKFYFLSATNTKNLISPKIVPGADLYFKFVPFTSVLGNITTATPIEISITGRSKKPYHPINLSGNDFIFNSLYTSNIVLDWDSRLRTEGSGIGLANDVTDAIPVWEGYFEIGVYVGDVLKRTVTEIDALTWTYTSSMNISDNGALADTVVFKLLNYIEENNYKFESSQVLLTVNKE